MDAWSQGSYGTVNGIDLGSAPVDATAWEKTRPRLVQRRSSSIAGAAQRRYKLSASNINTKQAQSLVVVLPDKKVTKELGAPYAGSNFYYSGAADSLNTTMTRAHHLAVPARSSLTAQARWNIEEGFDYAYLTVDGRHGPDEPVQLERRCRRHRRQLRRDTGSTLTADLVGLRRRDARDRLRVLDRRWRPGRRPRRSRPGSRIDDLAITGQPTDGAETDPGWTFASNQTAQGFHITSGTETFSYFNAYIAEYRTYGGYDKALKLGPYNFDDPDRELGRATSRTRTAC